MPSPWVCRSKSLETSQSHYFLSKVHPSKENACVASVFFHASHLDQHRQHLSFHVGKNRSFPANVSVYIKWFALESAPTTRPSQGIIFIFSPRCQSSNN